MALGRQGLGLAMNVGVKQAGYSSGGWLQACMWQQGPSPAVCSCSAVGVIHRCTLSSGSQNAGRGQTKPRVSVCSVGGQL